MDICMLFNNYIMFIYLILCIGEDRIQICGNTLFFFAKKKLALMKVYFETRQFLKQKYSISFIFALSRSCPRNKMVLSAYCRIDTPPFQIRRCVTNPPNWMSSYSLAISTTNISTTILKKIGDNGSPCLSPFKVSK